MHRNAGFAMALWVLLSAGVHAGSSIDEVRKSAEMSMLVTGTLEIEPDGRTGTHTLEQAAALPESVVALVASAVEQWRFEPIVVEGAAVPARTRMSLRVVASPRSDGTYALRIAGADFGDDSKLAPEEKIASDKLRPPRYPERAYSAGVQGTVYLIVRFGRSGAVDDAAVEQVNLTVVGNARQMEQGREQLADSALKAVKSWKFRPPTKGPDAARDKWTARVPVSFALCDSRSACDKDKEGAGKWRAYIPGPRHRPAWVDARDANGSPDALASNGAANLVGDGPKLLTPLDNG